ncbi:MAG: hypothetical protein AABW63_00860 [Nanoarchaeota archaeon]
MIDIKIVFTIVATFLTIIAFFPYIRNIFRNNTKPHPYTWLIWTLTQGTAIFAILYGGGNLGALSLTVGTILVFVIFLFSIKKGTKNIKKIDTIILILAICAILVWWQLDQPLISVIMVSAIDFFGYIPTIRKSWSEPRSETLSSWMLFVIANTFAILALESYNSLTLTYLITITLANLIIFFVCLLRRHYINPPNKNL